MSRQPRVAATCCVWPYRDLALMLSPCEEQLINLLSRLARQPDAAKVEACESGVVFEGVCDELDAGISLLPRVKFEPG